MNKNIAFEYIVNELYKWYNLVTGNTHTNDLNKLKILKLHFFVSAISCSHNEKGLLDTFDNFCAMPYGHVESDIYDAMESLDSIRVSRNPLVINGFSENYFNSVEFQATKNLIDISLKDLKSVNPNIITYTPFELVDLSHLWTSWRSMFNLAKSMNKSSIRIPPEMIQNEEKIFSLN